MAPARFRSPRCPGVAAVGARARFCRRHPSVRLHVGRGGAESRGVQGPSPHGCSLCHGGRPRKHGGDRSLPVMAGPGRRGCGRGGGFSRPPPSPPPPPPPPPPPAPPRGPSPPRPPPPPPSS